MGKIIARISFRSLLSSHCFIGSQIPREPALSGFALTFRVQVPIWATRVLLRMKNRQSGLLPCPSQKCWQTRVWCPLSPGSALHPLQYLDWFHLVAWILLPAYALWQVELTSLSSQGLPCLEGQWHPATQSGRGGQSYADLTLLLNSYASAV